jgi:hypothetical protein
VYDSPPAIESPLLQGDIFAVCVTPCIISPENRRWGRIAEGLREFHEAGEDQGVPFVTTSYAITGGAVVLTPTHVLRRQESGPRKSDGLEIERNVNVLVAPVYAFTHVETKASVTAQHLTKFRTNQVPGWCYLQPATEPRSDERIVDLTETYVVPLDFLRVLDIQGLRKWRLDQRSRRILLLRLSDYLGF